MKHRLKASIFLVLIFASGIIIGVVLDNYLPFLHFRKPNAAKFLRKLEHPGIYEQIIDELNFTPEQKDRFRQAMMRHGQRMRALFETHKPQIKQSWNTLKTDLDSFLTPDQQLQLEERLKKMHRHKDSFKPASNNSGPESHHTPDSLNKGK
ncbi:hypothetical protein JXJ21_20515 [candidate division KSB1 bacterium]|nr:hypothetical protein [candidate division KSB1 bacterium]